MDQVTSKGMASEVVVPSTLGNLVRDLLVSTLSPTFFPIWLKSSPHLSPTPPLRKKAYFSSLFFLPF